MSIPTLYISDNSFSGAHLNIRSIPANFSAFLSYMDNLEHCFTVIGMSQTWLNPTNVSAYGISGYNHVHRTRSTHKGGGVSLFVSEKCIYSEMANHCMVNDYIESLFVKITNNGMTFVIGIVYRQPNSDIVQFTETLNDILGEISHMPCHIMGDYNIDLLKKWAPSTNWRIPWGHEFKLFIAYDFQTNAGIRNYCDSHRQHLYK